MCGIPLGCKIPIFQSGKFTIISLALLLSCDSLISQLYFILCCLCWKMNVLVIVGYCVFLFFQVINLLQWSVCERHSHGCVCTHTTYVCGSACIAVFNQLYVFLFYIVQQTTVITTQPTATAYVSADRENQDHVLLPTIGLIFSIIQLSICLAFLNILAAGCLVPALICAIVVSWAVV